MAFCKPQMNLELWSALPAISFVALFITFSIPVRFPKSVSRIAARIWAPFQPTLTLVEAEELECQFLQETIIPDERSRSEHHTVNLYKNSRIAPKWRTAFAGLALMGVTAKVVEGVLILVYVTGRSSDHRQLFGALGFLTAATWAYVLVRVLHNPPETPPYDLFILSTLNLLHVVLTLGEQLYTSETLGTPWPSVGCLAAKAVDLGITITLFALIVSLPLNIPSADVDRAKIGTVLSPEDYTSLASWITFSWVKPLVDAGSRKTLNDEDVWDISPTLKTSPTFVSYNQIHGSNVLWKLLRANSMDLIIDCFFTVIGVFFDFAQPFFLRLILVGLETTGSSRFPLYLYATLAFAANLAKAQIELQHLWYGRRATSRIGTQISAAIYDKALRMKDRSGFISATSPRNNTTSRRTGTARENGKDGKEQDASKEEKEHKSSTDVGKIVNHMAIDCQTLMKQVSVMPTIYNAPVQLILSCVYLYSILGVSALAGFISLALALPLSRWLTKVTVRITHGTLAAKDSRMKLVNEMFGAIKFIKLFGWESQWIKRVIAARDVEISWLKNARNVNVIYSLIWMVVPTMGSILAFLTYVSTGHDLNASTAFTAIRLFDMLKKPLGALPYALVTLAQTRVSLERLEAFFNEEEVPDDVCSLTRSSTSEPQELKLENATFTWTKSRKLHRTEGTGTDGLSKIAETTRSTTSRTDEGEDIATPPNPIGAIQPDGMDDLFELRNISIQFAPRKLTVVTGPTASGKTALLLALLGEIDKVSGTASRPKNPTIVDEYGLKNSISYAAQTPWLQQQSIKKNIVFGYPMDEERYHTVVEACALDPDFDALEDGDLTEIGSKGVSLSGGQRARVALARAVYAPTQYIILDDIFSAVDTHTARFLFDRLLRGPLVAHRTVVLVTHHVDLVLPGTHYIVQMSEGRVEHQGTVKELTQKGLLDHLVNASSLQLEKSNIQMEAFREIFTVQERSNNPVTKSKMARKLVEEEVRAEGEVKWSIYNAYLKASSYWTWVCVLLGIVAAETFNVGMRLWVSIWGNAYGASSEVFVFIRSTGHFLAQPRLEGWDTLNAVVIHNFTATRFVSSGFPDARIHPLFYVAVYCGIGVAAAIVATLTQWVLFTGGIRGGRNLFRSLLMSLSVATFRFFDTTPTGRILNRFGKDFDTLDTLLPFMLYNTTTYLAAFLAAVITVIAVVPWFLPVGAVLAYCYARLSVGYLATGRDLRRMESTSRSPILAGFSDLVEGIVTVRAFSSEGRFLADHYKRVDTTNRFWYFTWMLNRWLLVRFDALGAASVYASTLFVLSGYISAGLAGLSMVSAMTFTSSVYWTCRGYTDLELSLNSVERVVEYLDIPKEPPAIIESSRVPAYWPSSSDSDTLLVVEDLEVKYAPELPSVLHDISFSLKARERVGLLGRTGCGKSTLAMSLLRFVEPFKGKVLIDGIDITTIGTHDLRSRVTFIAQDQALFLGTVRDNLDPFNQYTDTECLDALSRVHLIPEAASNSQENSRAPSRASSADATPEDSAVPSILDSEVATQVGGGIKATITLDTKVSAGGLNFSNGQRQLLTMARALLRQSGIVILDEATSSIDKATDLKIQAAIREEFHSSLLLTIAHRLETIIDFDRLIVLEKGRIVEFDTPLNLIQKEHGVFREMCIQSGSFEELETAIKSSTNY